MSQSSKPRRRVVMKVVHVDLFTGQKFVRPTFEVETRPMAPNYRGDGHDEARFEAAHEKRVRRAWRNQPVQEIPNG